MINTNWGDKRRADFEMSGRSALKSAVKAFQQKKKQRSPFTEVKWSKKRPNTLKVKQPGKKGVSSSFKYNNDAEPDIKEPDPYLHGNPGVHYSESVGSSSSSMASTANRRPKPKNIGVSKGGVRKMKRR